MPYISKEARRELNDNTTARNPGELNYELTRLVNRYLFSKGLSYATINDILGAFTGAQLEFYRRVALPYENKKITENGDVYAEEFAPCNILGSDSSF